ncbi:MAG: hypothetical protein Q7V57_19640 [Actinomycetota bacterium]|nr:hypothetical protein [Actinomycetota bacterium]
MILRRSALAAVLLLLAVPVTAHAHPGPYTPPSLGTTSAESTSGDYATDVYSDPWDFENDEDVPPQMLIGTEGSNSISRSGGQLVVSSRLGTNIKLVRSWGLELPWGRNGNRNPVDAGVYNRFSVQMCLTHGVWMAVHFWRADGREGFLSFEGLNGCHQYTLDLTNTQAFSDGYRNAWTGDIVRFDMFRGGIITPGVPQPPPEMTIDITIDWARLHRSNASATPPSGVPIPKLISPSEEGGTDYATANGNAWDFNGPDDVLAYHDINGLNYSVPGEASGSSIRNDSYIEFPLRTPLVPDRYHRATVEVCYGGAMSFANAPGGGMNARFAWYPAGGPWSETQDIIIYPGCNRMTIDLSTLPPIAVNDENTAFKRGWRGQKIERLRFDLNEDPGTRSFTIRDLRLADDAALTTTYDIKFQDMASASGTTADLYVTFDQNTFNGEKVRSNIPVTPNVENTLTWDGTDLSGAPLPNGTYWVYMVMKNTAGNGSAFATGPLRIQRAQSLTPTQYVPLAPARILDTRDGTGGNITPLGWGATTELDVRGVGGLPRTGVTAVVLNVTAVTPATEGFLTVYPADQPRPSASNLNFVAGQIVPNLVTVRVGDDGKIAIFNFAGPVDVVADVAGYYTDQPVSGGRFNAVSPTRLLDTRDGTGRGGNTAPVGPGGSIELQVQGAGPVPAGATAVALNVTVDVPTGYSFVTVWPTGQPLPTASNLNFVPGLTVANMVIAKVGAGGKVSLFNLTGNVHVIADVVGYFASTGSQFVPVVPQRIVDTRDGTGGRLGHLGFGEQFAVNVAGSPWVPAGSPAAVFNVTSTESTAQSYITAWPHGEARPTAGSTLNPRPGVAVPNQAYLKLGTGGMLDIFNFVGYTHVVVDVFGYMVDDNS